MSEIITEDMTEIIEDSEVLKLRVLRNLKLIVILSLTYFS